MTLRLRLVALFAAAALAACGGDDDGQVPDAGIGVGNDIGTGTQTLVVEAEVNAVSQVPNDQGASAFESEFTVHVTRGDQAVTDATVVIESANGPVTLAWTSEQTGGGAYRGSQIGYAEVYVLDVDAGTDNVHGVRLDGPDLHYLTAPDPNQQIDAAQPVAVSWNRAEAADLAGIFTADPAFTPLVITDTGNFTLQANTLQSSATGSTAEQIHVWRGNALLPAGGAGGSSFEVRVDNYLNVTVAQSGA